ncbi:uncharacterized protein DS421_9g272500 [Arachis hypogaea]|nr:uncharacterized protein DS421_9g272500 [Arachis hypogaea]
MRPGICANDFYNSADCARHASTSSTRLHHSAFLVPRGRVVHAFASFVQLPIRAVASGTRARHGNSFYFAWSRELCDCVTSRWSSPQFLVCLPFLHASSSFHALFLPYEARNT